MLFSDMVKVYDLKSGGDFVIIDYIHVTKSYNVLAIRLILYRTSINVRLYTVTKSYNVLAIRLIL